MHTNRTIVDRSRQTEPARLITKLAEHLASSLDSSRENRVKLTRHIEKALQRWQDEGVPETHIRSDLNILQRVHLLDGHMQRARAAASRYSETGSAGALRSAVDNAIRCFALHLPPTAAGGSA